MVVGTTDAADCAASELRADGHRVRHATTGQSASLVLAQGPIDAVLLYDLEGGTRAVETARNVRADRLEHPVADPDVPMLVAGCACDLDQVRAFEAGADDALPAAITHLVLRARIAALLRRSRLTTPAREVARIAGLVIDTEADTVAFDGEPVPLTPTGFRFLAHLAEDPRRLFTYDELLRAIWGFAEPVRTRAVTTCAARVRKTLKGAGATELIVTRRGCGYALLPPHVK